MVLETETVDTPEVAGNVLGLLDCLDAGDRGRLADVIVPRKLLAAAIDERLEAVVIVRAQMCGGARRHSATDPAAVNHDDPLSLSGELVGGRKTGDPAADDNGVGLQLTIKRCRIGRDLHIHP